jgi:DNA-binding XRE family transcriptional regulator
MNLEEIRKALEDRIIIKVAEGTGLNPHTIYRIQKGKHTPNIGTMKLLARYLKGEQDAN